MSDRVNIRELGEALDRAPATIRKWESDGLLPSALLPERGPRNVRLWKPEQVEGFRAWMSERRLGKRPVADYAPDSVRRHLKGTRKPRGTTGRKRMEELELRVEILEERILDEEDGEDVVSLASGRER